MRGKWIVIGVVAALALLLAYAWIDGGREPVRSLSIPVTIPEAAE